MTRCAIFRLAGTMAPVLALGLFLVSCSDDSDGSATTPDPDEGSSFSSTVTAAGGGTLNTKSGNATLDVPAGALAADTELTVKVSAKESATAGSVYEYGPEGTSFSTPATLSIKYDGSPGADRKAVLGTYSDGEWVEIPGSSAAGGRVTGKISHFSKFSVIIVDNRAVLASGCADVAQSFSPCGGDVQGTWTFQDVCFSDMGLGGNPWQECAEATMEFDVTWDATITIDATTMHIAWASQKTSYAFIAPLSCLPSTTNCSDITNQEMGLTCATDGSNCKCSGERVVSDMQDSTIPYTLEGNTIVTMEGGERSVSRYCRQGNQMIVEGEMESGDKGIQKVYQVMVKQ